MRRWSLLALMPCLVACAAVLGLEEATLDEDDASDGASGGDTGAGGKSGRAGSTGKGGAPSCNYDETQENGCLWSCVNDACCAEWVTCFENPASSDCTDYFACQSACDDDSECESECARSHPQGFGAFATLSLCLYSGECPCLEGEGGAGGGGGDLPSIGGRGGAGNSGGRGGASPAGGRGGRGGAGGATTPSPAGSGGTGGATTAPFAGSGGKGGSCNDSEPYACVDSSTLGYCEGGQRKTIGCDDVCTLNGFDATGAVCEDLCSCGPPLDAACVSGMQIECECTYDGACTSALENEIYSGCYRDEPAGARSYVHCLDAYATTAPDCETLVEFCLEGGSPPSPP